MSGHDASSAKPAMRARQSSVRADGDDAVHADPQAHVVPRAAGDDGHERVAACEPPQLGPRRFGRIGVVGALYDRREHAVEVEEETGKLRLGREPLHQRRLRSHRLSIGRCA